MTTPKFTVRETKNAALTWFFIEHNTRTVAVAYDPASARRIIACINACAEYSTEELEAGAITARNAQ